MKVMRLLLALLLSVIFFTGCTAATYDVLPGESVSHSAAPQETTTVPPLGPPAPAETGQRDDMLRISISVDGAVFEAQLLDNESARALVEQLPLTLKMADHAGQEKVITLPFELPPASTEKPDTIRAGELYLWSGNQLVLFYTPFANSYDGYVRLGAIEDVDGLAETLGSGDVTVTIEPAHPTEDNILVAYFSCTGNTEQIAQLIAEYTGADLYRIAPEVPYTAEDLDYGDSSSRSSKEQNNPSARPAIFGAVEGMEDYDTIFIGYPIWWGQAPKIISTFLENYDFSGKTIVPFCTSGSSGAGTSDTNLHSLCADFTRWLSGERFSTSASQESVREWIDSLGVLTAGATKNVGVFDFENKTVLLNSGYEMPIMGLGTYSLTDEECFNSVTALLDAGGRLIDTAQIYGNEESVGRAVRESSVPREEIFVITKLYPNQFSNAGDAIDEAIQKLDIGYIDMMLLHHPGEGDVEAYKAMDQAVADGKIRSIGLSNWYVEELEEFLPQITITPALVQNEIHPYYKENDVIPFIQEKEIAVQGWYPLGGRGHTAELLSNEVISEIAQTHSVSSAQVILRWNLQKSVVVIPGSSNPDHIRENLDIFGFVLTDEEMSRINALDRNEKHDWY